MLSHLLILFNPFQYASDKKQISGMCFKESNCCCFIVWHLSLDLNFPLEEKLKVKKNVVPIPNYSKEFDLKSFTGKQANSIFQQFHYQYNWKNKLNWRKQCETVFLSVFLLFFQFYASISNETNLTIEQQLIKSSCFQNSFKILWKKIILLFWMKNKINKNF